MSLSCGGSFVPSGRGSLLFSLAVVAALAGWTVRSAQAAPESDAYRILPALAGDPTKADVVLHIGHRTWYLEQVPDKAMVRLQKGQSLGSLQTLAVVSAAKASAVNPGENIALVETSGYAPGAATLNRVLAGDPAVAFVGPVYRAGDRLVGIADTLCAKFDSSVDVSAQQALIDSYGLTVVKSAAANHGVWKLAVPSAVGEDTVGVCQALSQEAGIVWASPNFFSQYALTAAGDVIPADHLFPEQWYLLAQSPPAIPESDINATQAWGTTEGDPNLIVGVIDSGVDQVHPELRVLPGSDASDGVGDGRPEKDSENHGTAVAGLIAAKRNSFGIVGVAPMVRILPVRLDFETPLSDDQIRDAFVFCVDQGASVINNSWGIRFPNDPCQTSDDLIMDDPLGPIVGDGLNYAFTVGRGGKGSVVLFSAGNDRANIDGDELAGHPLVIAVAATNNLAKRIWYSNYGSKIGLAAPSGELPQYVQGISCAGEIYTGGDMTILTTDRVIGGYNPGDMFYAFFNGTSASCPIASGVAALVLSVNSGLSHTDVRLLLERTAEKVDPVGGQYDGTGHSIYYGYGRVDAAAAVAEAASIGTRSRFFLEGWNGYSSISGLADPGDVVTPDRELAFTNIASFIGTNSFGRRILVTPELLNIDSRGIISGLASIYGFAPDGTVTWYSRIPVSGFSKTQAQGAVYDKIVVQNYFKLTGSGVISRVQATSTQAELALVVLPKPPKPSTPSGTVEIRGQFGIVGKQVYTVLPDDQTEVPPFAVTGSASITRYAVVSLASNVTGFVKNIASFSSPNLKSLNSAGTSWKGEGVLTDDFARRGGGAMTVSVSPANTSTGRPGYAKAIAKNGSVAARSEGYHDVAFGVLVDLGLVEADFEPQVLVLRGPATAITYRFY